MTTPQILCHLDRIIIGTTTIFLFKIPGENSNLREIDIDFEFALEEKSKNDEEEIENHAQTLYSFKQAVGANRDWLSYSLQ